MGTSFRSSARLAADGARGAVSHRVPRASRHAHAPRRRSFSVGPEPARRPPAATIVRAARAIRPPRRVGSRRRVGPSSGRTATRGRRAPLPRSAPRLCPASPHEVYGTTERARPAGPASGTNAGRGRTKSEAAGRPVPPGTVTRPQGAGTVNEARTRRQGSAVTARGPQPARSAVVDAWRSIRLAVLSITSSVRENPTESAAGMISEEPAKGSRTQGRGREPYSGCQSVRWRSKAAQPGFVIIPRMVPVVVSSIPVMPTIT